MRIQQYDEIPYISLNASNVINVAGIVHTGFLPGMSATKGKHLLATTNFVYESKNSFCVRSVSKYSINAALCYQIQHCRITFKHCV